MPCAKAERAFRDDGDYAEIAGGSASSPHNRSA